MNEHTGAWGWKKLLKLRSRFREGLAYTIRSRADFLLWLEPWHPERVLIDKFHKGPLLKGWQINNKLSEVIQEGRWSWPADLALEIRRPLHSILSCRIRIASLGSALMESTQ